MASEATLSQEPKEEEAKQSDGKSDTSQKDEERGMFNFGELDKKEGKEAARAAPTGIVKAKPKQPPAKGPSWKDRLGQGEAGQEETGDLAQQTGQAIEELRSQISTANAVLGEPEEAKKDANESWESRWKDPHAASSSRKEEGTTPGPATREASVFSK